MKKIIIVLLYLFVVYSCGNNTQKQDINQDSITGVNDSISVMSQDNLIEEKTVVDTNQILSSLQYLPDILKDSAKVWNEFKIYYVKLQNEINTEEQVKEILTLRDSLGPAMRDIMEKYYYSNERGSEEDWEKVEKELKKIGFLPIYVEGMYVTLDVAPILEEEIEKYCSEAFKLAIKFRNEYSAASGGEYPYAYMQDYFPAFESGEKLFTKYRNTEYYKSIKNDFKYILQSVVDVHKYEENCFVSEFQYSFYPYSTDCNFFNDFIKKYPNSIFTPVFEKINSNMSFIDINTNLDENIGEVYVIVTDKCSDYKEASDKVFEYVTSGTDIVHPLELTNNNDKNEYYVAYRFYPDKSVAEKNLELIKSVKPDAYILHVNIVNEAKYKIIE